MNMNILRTTLAAFLCLGLTGCYDFDGLSGSSPVGLPIDLTGTWSGTWTRADGTTGAFAGVFDQNEPVQGGGAGTTLSGSASLDGFRCSAPLSVDGSVSPGGFVTPPLFSGMFTDGAITLHVSALVFGVDFDGISGTYEVLAGSACAGETGTLIATIVAPLVASDPSPEFWSQTVLENDDGVRVEVMRTTALRAPLRD